MSSNGWNEHQRLVLSEIKRLSYAQEKISTELVDIRLLLEGTKFWNKVFSGLFGGLMGILAVIASELIRSFMVR